MLGSLFQTQHGAQEWQGRVYEAFSARIQSVWLRVGPADFMRPTEKLALGT